MRDAVKELNEKEALLSFKVLKIVQRLCDSPV